MTVPSASVVVEWETALEAGVARGRRCLESLQRQMADMSSQRPEIILCFDGDRVQKSALKRLLDEVGPWPGNVLLLDATGRDYYQQKNLGAENASGEVLVFIDSDVIPESGWLRAMLESFTGDVAVVVGRSHLETGTLLERAVALYWIFDARDPSSALRPTVRLFSNNVAFRRTLFNAMPFPDRPTYRGQCTELSLLLAARNVPMVEQSAARGVHPAPNGARALLERAIHAGRDQSYYDRLGGRSGLGKVPEMFASDLKNVMRRIGDRRASIKARVVDVTAAATVGTVYYTTKALAYAAAAISSTTSN